MSIHMFRVCVSREGYTVNELQSVLDEWIETHTKWDGQETDFIVFPREGRIDDESTMYHAASFRFERTDTKDNILQKLEDKLKNKVDWYRVGYHECYHDETGACSWDTAVEWSDKDVSIPSYVPDMQ